MNPYLSPNPDGARQEQGRIRSRPLLPDGFMVMAGVAVMVLNLLWVSLTMCMCGHMDLMTAIILVPSFAGMVFVIIKGRHNKAWERVMAYSFLAVLALMVAKNLSDILWNGHTPLFR